MRFKRAIFFFAVCASFWLSQGQNTGRSTTLDIKNNDNFSGYDILDSSLLKARVIMTGENHLYVKFNSKMELKMLRYLNKKIGLRNFVIELGAARAHYLNRYILDEKDTAAGNYLRATTSPRYMDLFNRLRKFNATLPDSQKIRIYGIDVERFNDLPLMRLSELLPVDNAPAEIRVGVETVKSAADYLLHVGLKEYESARDETSMESYQTNYDEVPFYVTPTIVEFIRYYDSLQPVFKSWLGSNYEAVNEAVNWLKEFKQWNEYDNTTFQYIWREENIYRNFSTLVSHNPNERFYGQFGRCHIAYEEQNGECGWYGYHSVVNKMRSRYFHNKDSVLTIGLFYGNSNDNSRYYSDREEDKAIQAEIDVLMDDTKAKTVTLFHLEDEAANLPRLVEKFSYAIVNKSSDFEEEDSVESEIITWKDKLDETFRPVQYLAYGYTYTTINMDVLGNHVASNGYTTALGAFATQDIIYGRSGSVLDHGFQFSFRPSITLHQADSGSVKYVANQLHYRLGYQIIHRKNLQFNAGTHLGYGREKVTVTQEGTSFLATRKDKEFVNPAFFIGGSAQLNFTFARFFYLGFRAAKLFDVSEQQWRFRGSTQDYGSNHVVSNGYSGYYFTASIGFVTDFDR